MTSINHILERDCGTNNETLALAMMNWSSEADSRLVENLGDLASPRRIYLLTADRRKAPRLNRHPHIIMCTFRRSGTDRRRRDYRGATKREGGRSVRRGRANGLEAAMIGDWPRGDGIDFLVVWSVYKLHFIVTIRYRTGCCISSIGNSHVDRK